MKKFNKKIFLGKVDRNTIYRKRETVKAVIFDESGRIGVLYVKKQNRYKLPGGGIEKNEDKISALIRECAEEMGVEISETIELGKIEEIRVCSNLHQTSYCFATKIINNKKSEVNFSKKEIELEFSPVWVEKKDVLKLFKKGKNIKTEDSFAQRRDLYILEMTLKKLKERKKNLKIAITGAHSTGKTTLARLCCKILGFMYLRGDTVRKIMEERFPGKSFDALTKKEYWLRERLVLKSRLKTEFNNKTYITDGCTLNSVAYAEASLGKARNQIKNYANFTTRAINNAKKYDYIFYLPPEIPLKDDNFRPMSRVFREKIDKILRRLLKKRKHYTITGTPAERVKLIEKIINI